MTNWVDAEERKSVDVVLTYSFRGSYASAAYDEEDDEWYDDDGEMVYGVTHWSILPEAPQ